MRPSDEQIAANKAATHKRRQEARERAIAKRDAEREAERIAAIHPYEQYSGKLIGFVVHTRKGYKPFIGQPIPADPRDSFISVRGSQAPQATLEQALAVFAPDRDKFALVLEKPVRRASEGVGFMHWLAEMLKAQE